MAAPLRWGSTATPAAHLSLNSASRLSLNGSNTGTIQLNGGSLIYTGSAGNVTNANGGSSIKVASLNLTAPTSTLGVFATTFQTPLTALSTQLNGVAANSTATSANGTVTFNAAPNGNGVAVFDVNTSLFSGASSVAINTDGATSVIINVNVSSCVVNVCTFSPTANFQNPTGYASTVLWELRQRHEPQLHHGNRRINPGTRCDRQQFRFDRRDAGGCRRFRFQQRRVAQLSLYRHVSWNGYPRAGSRQHCNDWHRRCRTGSHSAQAKGEGSALDP